MESMQIGMQYILEISRNFEVFPDIKENMKTSSFQIKTRSEPFSLQLNIYWSEPKCTGTDVKYKGAELKSKLSPKPSKVYLPKFSKFQILTLNKE